MTIGARRRWACAARLVALVERSETEVRAGTKGPEAEVKSGTEFGIYLNQAISLPRFAEEVPMNP